jgi:hypothetical protein
MFVSLRTRMCRNGQSQNPSRDWNNTLQAN